MVGGSEWAGKEEPSTSRWVGLVSLSGSHVGRRTSPEGVEVAELRGGLGEPGGRPGSDAGGVGELERQRKLESSEMTPMK